MEYAVNDISGKKITFGMTINGTLLEYDFLKRVANFNFAITISLDGPVKYMIRTVSLPMAEAHLT